MSLTEAEAVALKSLTSYLDMLESLKTESTEMSTPEAVIDFEIIKENIAALDAKLNKIIGYLEALQASRRETKHDAGRY